MSNGKSHAGQIIPPADGLSLGVGARPLPLTGAGLGGELKVTPEDFRVEELRPEPLSGEGEHFVVQVEKRGLTTEAVADWLARACGVGKGAVGYAGLKDKQAVAVQSFSVHLPGVRDWPVAPDRLPAGLRLLEVGRHARKIRPGHLAGNRFQVRLRGRFAAGAEREVARVAAWVGQYGFANYFGEQRFGFEGANVAAGLALLQRGRSGRGDRHQSGLLVSSVRSALFNQVLALRVAADCFDRLLDGDVAQLAGRSAAFLAPVADVEAKRFASGAIHPSGPLYGRNLLQAEGEPGEWERRVAEAEAEAVGWLAGFGLDGGRRAVRVIPQGLSWQWQEGGCLFSFSLPAGVYATELMRCFCET